jgi:SAM-dependent methyltransferase
MGVRTRLRSAVLYVQEAGSRALLTPLLKAEWEGHSGGAINEGAVGYQIALRALTDHDAREVLDVGTGTSPWPQLLVGCGFRVTAIDEVAGYWGPAGFFNRHFYVQRDDIRHPNLRQRFDFITCCNVMSTISDDQAAVAGMFRMLKPGGHLFLSFPYNETHSVDNAYELPDAGYGQNARYGCRIYSRAEIEAWLRQQSAELVEQEYYRVFTGAYWTVGERVTPAHVTVDDLHHFTAIVIRRVSE